MNKKTFYVTTPIYYPSGTLHIGHVFTTTLAWTLRNYKTKMGYDAKMLTGADEHGLKIQRKAEENKMNPQEYVDKMTDIFKSLWTKLEIDYDYYSRTTSENHVKSVQKIFSDLSSKGDIYKDYYEGLYSVSDEEFFTEKDAVKKEDGYYSPVSDHKLELVKEESYFFKLSKYEEWLKKYIKNNPTFIVNPNTTKELFRNFLDKGLEELSVTRSTFTWGVPILEDDKHILYVWLDALSNYITALGYNNTSNQDFIKYWENGDEIVHIMAKEITRFHCIYWPIMLEALELKQPTSIVSHGWIVTSTGKMSKSKGNVIDPLQLIDEYGPEVVKYYFASKFSLDQDGTFDEEFIKSAYNNELANIFGNLLSRTIAMSVQNFGEQPIKYSDSEQDIDLRMKNDILAHTSEYKEMFDKFQLKNAFESTISLGRKLNNYIDQTTPWLLKTEDEKVRLEKILNTLLNGIYAIYTMLSVVMPNKANEAMKLLGQSSLDFNEISNWNKFNTSQLIKSTPLFERKK